MGILLKQSKVEQDDTARKPRLEGLRQQYHF